MDIQRDHSWCNAVIIVLWEIRTSEITTQQTQNILYNICTTSAQRLRRWSNILQMLYKMFCVYWERMIKCVGDRGHYSDAASGCSFLIYIYIYSRPTYSISSAWGVKIIGVAIPTPGRIKMSRFKKNINGLYISFHSMNFIEKFPVCYIMRQRCLTLWALTVQQSIILHLGRMT